MTLFWPKIQILRNFHDISLDCMAGDTVKQARMRATPHRFVAHQTPLCKGGAA